MNRWHGFEPPPGPPTEEEIAAQYSPSKYQCVAVTNKMRRCRKHPLRDSSLCETHQKIKNERGGRPILQVRDAVKEVGRYATFVDLEEKYKRDYIDWDTRYQEYLAKITQPKKKSPPKKISPKSPPKKAEWEKILWKPKSPKKKTPKSPSKNSPKDYFPNF